MFSMWKTITWIALSGMLAITAAQAQDRPPGSAPATSDQSATDRPRWQIEDTTCEQLLAAPEDDRASAALFYYGYLAGRANITSLDAQQIEVNIAKVIDYCVQNPNTTVPRAFIQALGLQSRQ